MKYHLFLATKVQKIIDIAKNNFVFLLHFVRFLGILTKKNATEVTFFLSFTSRLVPLWYKPSRQPPHSVSARTAAYNNKMTMFLYIFIQCIIFFHFLMTFLEKNLHISEKSSTFAADFD